MCADQDLFCSKEDAETATRIKFTTQLLSLAFQDALEINNGSTEDANVFQDTTWPMEFASLATVMKFSTSNNKDVSPTVETTHITFHHQEHANARKDFTGFWVNAEFVVTVKLTAQVLSAVWARLSCARPTKSTTHQQKLANVLPATTESMEFVFNA